MSGLRSLVEHKHFLKIAIAVKLFLVLGIMIAIDDSFYFGEKPTVAADNKETPKDGEAPKTEKPTEKSDEKPAEKSPDSKAEEKPASNGSEPGEAKTSEIQEPKRPSFLDRLLNLPALQTDNMKKEELGRYLSLAERKKRQVEDRVQLLEKREEQLKNLEKSVEEKLAKLEEERRFFGETIQKEKDLKGERLEKLVELYQKMEPKKAAPVFEKLDKDLVVALFKAMPQKQVTSILELMDSQKSVELSEYYGRLRSGREYEVLKELNQSLRKEFQDCKGMPQGIITPGG